MDRNLAVPKRNPHTDSPPPDSSVPRCAWAEHGSPAERQYHDTEWGVPHHGEAALFEILSLEGAQAGLSWSTILARRDGYRRAFAGFDADTIAAWGPEVIDHLVQNPGIIRHRGKIASVLANAHALRALREDGADLDTFLWSYTGGTPLQPRYASADEVPSTTDTARRISRDLKKRGFRFVGPTAAYALMQAAGLTNDHTTDCHRHTELTPRPSEGAQP
ncbi:DNA-3-methyladenine glycosylase I [Streptomyces sp. NPDC086549]|uniref:DNA-3-methyladenine glycosylase I n=1 Tax=Streptomyces sp. NPDC086549 TaxID=3365752 RepID=UPI00380F7FB7